MEEVKEMREREAALAALRSQKHAEQPASHAPSR